jgi:polysaccharide deacetylase 2 family uncharacterized protein YibQ
VRLLADALRFTLNGTPAVPTVDVSTPRISLIIDDAGAQDPTQTWTTTYKLLHLSRPMTVAVMPFRSYSGEVAQAAVAQGFEVILHQPMQAVSSANPGTGAIWDYMTDADVLETVQANLDSIPEAVGMNNHMGSLITQDENKMGIVVDELKARGLFFVDSRTISTAAAYDVAKDAALLTGERDLFIDGNNKSEAKEFIRLLAEKALYAPNEPHIGIGHVRSSTIDAIAEMIPELEAMGVELLPVSKSISQALETDKQPQGASFSTFGNWTPTADDMFSKELLNGNALVAECSADGVSVGATFRPNLQYDAYYRVYVCWHEVENPATDVRVTIQCGQGRIVRSLDLGARPNAWHYLGRYFFRAGDSGYVTLDDANVTTAGQTLIVDGAKWIFDEHVTVAPLLGWTLY